MPTQLTEFLLARIEEDEENARRKAGHLLALNSPERRIGTAGTAAFSPFRVLAECEAKRRIVDQCADATDAAYAGDYDLAPRYDLGMDVLALLALPYAGHPDYRQEWKP